MNMQTAVVVSRDTWLPPFRASLPKVRIVANNIPIKIMMGKRDTIGEGIFFVGLMRYVAIKYNAAKI